MGVWRRWRRATGVDAHRSKVRAQASAVLARLRTEGQSPRYLRSLEVFVDLAPAVLALGPAPASLTMRVLYGLSSFEHEARRQLLATLTTEFASPSPTLRAILRSGLVTLDEAGCPVLTASGAELCKRLHRVGAFDGTT
jgi:hypothetical protein